MRFPDLKKACLAGLFILPVLTFSQTRHDLFIPVSGSDSLDATYFVPPQAPPAKGYPGIIFVHGFGFDKFDVMPSCSLYSVSGYLTLCYSVRGHGNSSGGSTIMANRERADFAEVVNWLRRLPNIDAQAIGVTGGSQGGLHGLWAAADRLPVKAVTSDVIVPRWASDMLSNGCIRRTLLLLLRGSAVRYDQSRDTLWSYVRSDQFDSLERAFPAGRDVDTGRLNSSDIPRLQMLKWQDHYFGAEDGIEAFNRYSGPKKIYIGTRGHFSDQAESERVYQYDQVTRWLDYYLRDVQNGIATDPQYTYAYSSLPMDSAGNFTWTRVGVKSWPVAGVQDVRLYLHPDSEITLVAPPGVRDSLILSNNYLNPSYNFDTAYVEGFRGNRFNVLLPKRTLSFLSSPLEDDFLWVGTPRMHLFVQSANAEFPIHAQIYEVDSAGNKYFINRINSVTRHWEPGTEGTLDVRGIPHAHKFLRGNRIRIELTNIDVTNRLTLGSYPFVVPIFAQTAATIFMDASHQSYIALPMMDMPTGVVSSIVHHPVQFVLRQNYPNPFNPSTAISYSLAHAQSVSLKVFDLLGREVASLVEREEQPGEKIVHWDASNLGGGVYFYRLQAGEAQETRKMVLLK